MLCSIDFHTLNQYPVSIVNVKYVKTVTLRMLCEVESINLS